MHDPYLPTYTHIHIHLLRPTQTHTHTHTHTHKNTCPHTLFLVLSALLCSWNLTERPGAKVRDLKCEKHVSALQLISDTTLVTSSMDGKVGMHVLCVLVCIHVCVCVHIAG